MTAPPLLIGVALLLLACTSSARAEDVEDAGDVEDTGDPGDIEDAGDVEDADDADAEDADTDQTTQGHTPIPDFVRDLPQPVQDVVENMAETRDPPMRLILSVFNISRARFSSGTAWLPDASPIYAAVPSAGRWGFFVQGNLFTGYSWFGSRRGGRRFMGRNTLQVAAFRTFPRSEFQAKLALSFEPLTIGERGYPLILQTGQTRDGTLLHDRQYALDFFRELAVSYSWQVSRNWAGSLYFALSGEPALGPPSFTQRVSASADPLAPLGFQWQEMSHASYGVLTVGAFTRKLRLEASWFNGEVPGSKPYSIALRKPDSYSVRAAYNPALSWSMQASYGFLERPVASEPGRSVHRLSASVSYTRWVRLDAGFAATVSVAERIKQGGGRGFALLSEAYWNFDGHHAVFARAELLQKSDVELVLPEPRGELFAVGSVASGYVYYFGPLISLSPGLGLRATVSPMESGLSPYYGTRAAWGMMLFAQLRTSALPVDS